MRHHVTSSTPVGCVAALFWVFLAIADALIFWISYRAYHANPPKIELGARFFKYGIVLGVALLISLIVIYKLCMTAEKRVNDGSRAITR